MVKQTKRALVLTASVLFIVQCAWFAKEPEDLTLVKPVPVGGYAAMSTRIHYPKDLRELGIEGTVQVRVHVSEEGVVEEAVISQPLHPQLDQIVSNALKRTSFTPATRGGQAVDVWIAIPFVFALKDWQDSQTPFSSFQMLVTPDAAYQSFHVEMKARLVDPTAVPLRFECLLPVNHENPWVSTDAGPVPQTGLVRDDRGEWLVFELNDPSVSFGFQYKPIYDQSNTKFQYGFSLNYKLPDWKLSVIYDEQSVIFKQDPSRIIENADGGKRFEYDMLSLDAYDTRYLEIELMD